jgi:hypothetical protein
MSARASGTFKVGSWDEKAIVEDDDGRKLTRASIAGAYAGDMEGESTSESVMCYRPDGTATFVSMERIEGRLGGRAGSFVLRSTGTYDGSEARATLSIEAGSGTGDLEGIAGEGLFRAPKGPEGTFELEYRFE